MLQLLLFLPILVLACSVLSSLHFDSIQRMASYAWRNIFQLGLSAVALALLVYFVTP